MGVHIAAINMPWLIDYTTRYIDQLSGQYICVANVHTTVTARDHKSYLRVQNSALMALPDGGPLSVTGRRMGYKSMRRTTGPDYMEEVFKLSASHGYRHFFYGSTEETLAKMRRRIGADYPELTIAGMYSPPFRALTKEEDEEIVRKINDAKADFVWVALGAPKQEIWMYRHRGRIRGLMIGVGAAFDYKAGTLKRAPEWMQERNLEWVARLAQEPRRLFSRYLNTNTAYLRWDHRQRRMDPAHLRIVMYGQKRVPSREGGVEVVVEALSTRMAAKGHRVTLYNRRSGVADSMLNTTDSMRNVQIRTLPTIERRGASAVSGGLFGALKSAVGHFDAVHIHAEGMALFAFLPKLAGKRVVVTVHGLDHKRAKWQALAKNVILRGERQAVRHADAIIVLSRDMQQYFRETYGRDTIFIPNGIECPTRRKADVITARYGLRKNDYILFLGRIVPEKGLHYALEAFRNVKTKKRFVIAGAASDTQEYLREMTEKGARDDRVIFTGFIEGEMLAELYSNAYLYVLPSDLEGMPLSLLEAMSYGNCCLVSDIPECTEVVGNHAVTFRRADIADLSNRMQELIDDEKRVRQYREQASAYICDKYRWDDVVNQTLAIYRDHVPAPVYNSWQTVS